MARLFVSQRLWNVGIHNRQPTGRLGLTSMVTAREWDGMEWNGRWNGMEGIFRDGRWKIQGWNGMEDLDDGMEEDLPSFHPNSIIYF